MSTYSGAGTAQRRARKLLTPAIRGLWPMDLQGFDRLPDDGAAILCPNHISFIDSVFLASMVRRNVSFVGKAEYLNSWKTKHLFPMLGMIPIDRSGGDKAHAALQAAEQVLRRGELFAMYPEGTRSRDGRLYKGRTGAARLAMTVGCPIFPVGIIGTDEVQPCDAKVPRPRKHVSIRIGRPVKPDKYADREEPHLAWRSMIDEVMFEIHELAGQEYVNAYAGQPEVDATTPSHPAHVTDPDPRPEARRGPVLVASHGNLVKAAS